MMLLSLRSFPFLLVVVTLLATVAVATAQTTGGDIDDDLYLDGGGSSGTKWDEDRWWVQVDGVMGGRSSGFLEFENNNQMITFSGDIVTQGGGFSSVRKWFWDKKLNLRSYAGIVVELEAHRYTSSSSPLGLHLQLSDDSSRYGYSASFAVPLVTRGQQQRRRTSVFLPMSSFARAGFPCWNQNRCGSLNTRRITEMDFYVLFQAGEFEVSIHSIRAVKEEMSFASPAVRLTTYDNQVKNLIESTISRGSAVYNYDYPELCIAIYRSTLNTLLASTGGAVSNGVKNLICEGLQLAESFGEDDTVGVAFSLRDTLDELLDLSSSDAVVTSKTAELDDGCIGVTSFPLVPDNVL